MSEEFRKHQPAPLPPSPFNVRRPYETRLGNGLRLVVLSDRRVPLVSLRLVFLAGDAYEPRAARGLNSAFCSLLTEGTENLSSRQIADEVERLGASIAAGSGQDSTRLSASCLSPYLPDVLRLMEELIFRPTFPDGELSLYKQNTIEGLKFQRSQSAFLAGEQTSRIVYGDHPYSVVSPSPADVEALTREQLAEHHRRQSIPNNAVLIAVGDVDPDDFAAGVDSALGSWEQGKPAEPDFPPVPERRVRSLTIVDRPGSSQANIVLAQPGPARLNPDFYAIQVLNQVLGAGASSRLFMNLREEKGYTYGAYSKFDMKRLAGDFEASAEVRTAVTGDALNEFFVELERIREEAVPENELDDARNYLTGVFPIRAETQEGLTNLIVQQSVYGLGDDYLEKYRERIAAVTAEDVRSAAGKYIDPDTMAIVIVGDAGEIRPQVGGFSDVVEVFDIEGNPIAD